MTGIVANNLLLPTAQMALKYAPSILVSDVSSSIDASLPRVVFLSVPPTRAFEDNSATISQVLKDRLTPHVKHLDMKVLWLHQQKIFGIFLPLPCPTTRQVADFNSKPTGGPTLQQSLLYIVGARFYPPPSSIHYKLLHLSDYNIGIHRGSFCLDT